MDYVQPRDVAAVKADKNVVVLDVPSLAAFAYQLNHQKPPFNNKALRQAVAYSLDLEQIVKGVWLNVGVPANGPIPPTSWAYDKSIPYIKRDLAKAKARLAEGGKPGGFEFTMTTANIPINVQEAELIRLLQDELPMVYTVHPVEPKAFSPRVQGYEPIPDGMMRFKDVWLK